MKTGVESIVEQFNDIVHELVQTSDITLEDARNLAVKLQENLIKADYNEMYAKANVVNTLTPTPSALEKIAMELEKFNNNN
jgi:polyhydroxyalkanoate synthesis regulator phasin